MTVFTLRLLSTIVRLAARTGHLPARAKCLCRSSIAAARHGCKDFGRCSTSRVQDSNHIDFSSARHISTRACPAPGSCGGLPAPCRSARWSARFVSRSGAAGVSSSPECSCGIGQLSPFSMRGLGEHLQLLGLLWVEISRGGASLPLAIGASPRPPRPLLTLITAAGAQGLADRGCSASLWCWWCWVASAL